MNPVLPLATSFVLPGSILELVLQTTITLSAIEQHLNTGKALLVLPMLHEIPYPKPEDIFLYGCSARVLRCLDVDNHSKRILLEGLQRIRIEELQSDDLLYLATPFAVHEQPVEEDDLQFWYGKLHSLFSTFMKSNPNVHPDLIPLLDINNEPSRLMHTCAAQLNLSQEQRILYLSQTHPIEQIQLLITHLQKEFDFQNLNTKLIESVQEKIEHQNQAYFIRNHIEALQKELHDNEPPPTDSPALKKIHTLLESNPPPTEIKEDILAELQRISHMSADSSEYNVGLGWLNTLCKLPWNSPLPPDISLKKARAILDGDHYGLEKIKERIIEQLAVQTLKNTSMGTILCLVGPPGVGKTSLAQSIAQALDRPFARISLGGVKDEADIRGHRRTYIGSMPGRIIRAILKAKSASPVLLLDEIDKIGRDVRGDPSSALLEVLDPEQHQSFMDHYVDQPFDLSKVMFICTANQLDNIDRALYDRLEILELHSYTQEEKVKIIQKHLLGKIAAQNGIDHIDIKPHLLPFLIEGYTREAGLRKVSQHLSTLARKTAIAILDNQTLSIQNKDQLRELLGPEIPPQPILKTLPIGQSLGMAWTPVGGEVLHIQASLHYDGTGKRFYTGNLGTVMKESIDVALSYIYSSIAPANLSKNDLHMHVPQGAISKDGPSAGVAIAIALFSLFKDVPAPAHIAITGELDISGRIYAVGGIKEKCLAAHRHDITHVIIPKTNTADVDEIPKELRTQLQISFVTHIDEVIALCFP